MKLRYIVLACLLIGAIGVGLFWMVPRLRQRPVQSDPVYPPPAVAFAGDSEKLFRSVVIPTLDCPMPRGKNVIWCSTFQMAWDRLRADVIGEPVNVVHAENVAARLNRAMLRQEDLPGDSSYAAAGRVADETVAKIRREMLAHFQKEPRGLDAPADALVAYGYLAARVRFTIPYFDNHKEFFFTEGQGQKTAVSSFGIREEDNYAYAALRKQIEVLYSRCEQHGGEAEEFALDLCRDSKPNQVVVACVPRKETLAATLDDLTGKMAAHPGSEYGPHPICDAVVLVPNMNWSIQHHFRELEGPDKTLRNRGFEKLWIATAMQAIDFRLDRSGVELESEAKIRVAPMPIDYRVDRPFLVYVKKRGAESPFFVMWVDNVELLSKLAETKTDSQPVGQ